MKPEELINRILAKKELDGLSFDFAYQELSYYINKHHLDFSLMSEKEIKLIIKEVLS